MKNRKRCRKEIGKRHIFKEIVWSVWAARNRHENRWRTRFIEILLFVLLHNRRRRCSSLQRLKVSALNPFPRPSPVILRSRQSLNRPRTRFNGKKNEFLSLPANSSRRVSRRLFSIFQQFYIFPSLSSKSSSFLFFYFFIFIIFLHHLGCRWNFFMIRKSNGSRISLLLEFTCSFLHLSSFLPLFFLNVWWKESLLFFKRFLWLFDFFVEMCNRL